MGAFSDLLDEIASRPRGGVITILISPDIKLDGGIEDLRDMVKWCGKEEVGPTFRLYEGKPDEN